MWTQCEQHESLSVVYSPHKPIKAQALLIVEHTVEDGDQGEADSGVASALNDRTSGLVVSDVDTNDAEERVARLLPASVDCSSPSLVVVTDACCWKCRSAGACCSASSNWVQLSSSMMSEGNPADSAARFCSKLPCSAARSCCNCRSCCMLARSLKIARSAVPT